MRKEPIENNQVTVIPPGGKKGSIALTKMQHVRAELAAVYREARTGKLHVADGTRLCFILQVLAKIIEGGELEQRIEALEAAQGDNSGKFGR